MQGFDFKSELYTLSIGELISLEAETEIEPDKSGRLTLDNSLAEADFLLQVYKKNLL